MGKLLDLDFFSLLLDHISNPPSLVRRKSTLEMLKIICSNFLISTTIPTKVSLAKLIYNRGRKCNFHNIF